MSILEDTNRAGSALVTEAESVVLFSEEFRTLVKNLIPAAMLYTWTGQESLDVLMGRLQMRRLALSNATSAENSALHEQTPEFLLLDCYDLEAVEVLLGRCMKTQGRILGPI